MDYSVVIPLYNESQNLKVLHQRLRRAMGLLSDDYDIIFIDDGSTDSSYEVLGEIAFSDRQVKVLSFDKNYGQHPAIIAGFEIAKGKCVITLDSDLQNPPEEIPKVVRKIRQGYDVVAGRRKMRKDTFLRGLSSFFINPFFCVLTGVYLKDYGTNLRVFKLKIAKEIAERYHRERLYIPLLLLKITKNVVEIEVNHAKRYRGESRYNFIELSAIIFRIALRFNSQLCQFFKRLHFVKNNEPLYQICKKIINGKEVSLL